MRFARTGCYGGAQFGDWMLFSSRRAAQSLVERCYNAVILLYPNSKQPLGLISVVSECDATGRKFDARMYSETFYLA